VCTPATPHLSLLFPPLFLPSLILIHPLFWGVPPRQLPRRSSSASHQPLPWRLSPPASAASAPPPQSPLMVSNGCATAVRTISRLRQLFLALFSPRPPTAYTIICASPDHGFYFSFSSYFSYIPCSLWVVRLHGAPSHSPPADTNILEPATQFSLATEFLLGSTTTPPCSFLDPPPCQSPPDDTRPLDTPSVSFPSPMRTAQTSYPLNGMDSPVVTTEAAAQARSSASQPPTALAPELRSCHQKTTIVRQLSLPPDPEPRFPTDLPSQCPFCLV
jgi:hypothetical protein